MSRFYGKCDLEALEARAVFGLCVRHCGVMLWLYVCVCVISKPGDVVLRPPSSRLPICPRCEGLGMAQLLGGNRNDSSTSRAPWTGGFGKLGGTKERILPSQMPRGGHVLFRS